MGLEIWGRQLTTRGVKLGSQKGVILATQNEPKFGGAPNSISPRRLGDRIRHSIRDPPGVQQRLPCPWLSKIFMPLGVVTIPIGSTNAKMAKLSTLTLGWHLNEGCSASPTWCAIHGDQCPYHPCHVWSIGPCVRRARGAEHGARRAANMENCSKWPKMRTLMVGANEAHARLGPECAIGLVSSHMCPTYLLGVAQLLRFWEWQGRQVSP